MNTTDRYNRVYMVIMLFAGLFGLMYVMTAYSQFVQNAMKYEAVNTINVMTAILRLDCVLLPLVFVMPKNIYFPKIAIQKILLIILCISSIAGFIWVFQYLSYISMREIFDGNKMYTYQGIQSNYIAVNRFLWGHQGFAGVVLSAVLCIMYGILAAVVEADRKIIAIGYTLICGLRIVAPTVIYLVTRDFTVYKSWLEHNFFCVLSAVIFLAGVWVAARTDEKWLELVWGEVGAPPEEEDEEELA